MADLIPADYNPKEGTYLGCRFDLIEPSYLKAIAEVLCRGAEKYGEWSWVDNTDVHSNLNHAFFHLLGALDATLDGNDALCAEHIAHAATRLMFAYSQSGISDEGFEP